MNLKGRISWKQPGGKNVRFYKGGQGDPGSVRGPEVSSWEPSLAQE
ncbi:hypothetical protein [Neomoorella thermoacetica]|nr:hypothetical protein [Moorella thermoacetica]